MVSIFNDPSCLALGGPRDLTAEPLARANPPGLRPVGGSFFFASGFPVVPCRCSRPRYFFGCAPGLLSFALRRAKVPARACPHKPRCRALCSLRFFLRNSEVRRTPCVCYSVFVCEFVEVCPLRGLGIFSLEETAAPAVLAGPAPSPAGGSSPSWHMLDDVFSRTLSERLQTRCACS